MDTVPKLFVANGFRSQTKKKAIKSSSKKQFTKCHRYHISFFVKVRKPTVSKLFQVVNLTNTQLTEPFFYFSDITSNYNTRTNHNVTS